MGYLSSGMVSTWMATCQIHSNCASVCFELQLGCCYGAKSPLQHQGNCHCTAQEHLKSDFQAGASSLIWKVVLSKLMLLVLVFSMKHWKTRCFLFCQVFCCDTILVSILLNPHHGTTFLWSNQNVFGRSETFGNTEVDFRLFSRQRHTISRTFEVSESESDFAHFGSEGCGWVMHIDTLILKAYWSGYGMNEDFSLKLPIEGSENL